MDWPNLFHFLYVLLCPWHFIGPRTASSCLLALLVVSWDICSAFIKVKAVDLMECSFIDISSSTILNVEGSDSAIDWARENLNDAANAPLSSLPSVQHYDDVSLSKLLSSL